MCYKKWCSIRVEITGTLLFVFSNIKHINLALVESDTQCSVATEVKVVGLIRAVYPTAEKYCPQSSTSNKNHNSKANTKQKSQQQTATTQPKKAHNNPPSSN